MKSLKSKINKSAKAKARRKDYKKKKNVLRNNVKNNRFHLLTSGGGILPKSRKFKKPTASPVQ